MKDASNATTEPAALEFDKNAGSSRSKWIAGLLTLAIIGWMGSGFVLTPEKEEELAEKAARIVAVAVRNSAAKPVEQVFSAEGQALPDRETAIRAETSGQIEAVMVKKGDRLEAGDIIGTFETDERAAQLARAEEDLKRAQRDLENAETLLARGAQTADRVSETRADLKAAEAQMTSARKAIEDTILTAPFAGRLDVLAIDPGEFVSMGSEIARIIDVDPLTIAFQVPQQALGNLKEGQVANVSFITGEKRQGAVTFVGTNADAATRTFRAEVEIANADGAIPAGLSARVAIPTGQAVAHFISPAILSLGVDGTLGIKTVTAEDTVEFHEISIVRAQTDGIWVAGLPDEAAIITVGQGFVRAGETVEPRAEEPME